MDEALAEAKAVVEVDHEAVVAAGGLHIIGTERHESRRIDNQLRGRAARQGDPGSSRFYLSLDDDLMKRFASDRVAGLMERMGLEDDVAIESKLVSRTIESAQSRVEGFNFDIRKRVVEFDDVINKQRETIYAERDKVLRNEDLTETVREFLDAEMDELADQYVGDPSPSEWNLEGLSAALHAMGIDGPGTSEADLDEVAVDPRGGWSSTCASSPTTSSRRAGRSTARRSGARSSGSCCCARSTACGSSTSPSSTTCAAASACAATPSRTRSTSSARRPTACTRSSAASSAARSRRRSSA